MAEFNTNDSRQRLVNVTIGVEKDAEVFLYLAADGGGVEFDLYTASKYEIDRFFEEVDEAKKAWERLREES